MPPSPARRRDHRTAWVVAATRHAFHAAAMPLLGGLAGLASERAVVAAASPRLDAAIHATWDGVPVRDWASRMSTAAGVPVVVDLRLDPALTVTLTSGGETAGDVLARVAASIGAVAEPVGETIRLVPANRAGRAAAAAMARDRAIPRLPPALRRVAERRAAWSWPAAARPRDLVTAAARDAGLQFSGLERIPHDHLPSGSLPSLPLADRLDTLLASFDLRVDWGPSGASITSLDAGIEPPDAVRLPAGREASPTPTPRRNATEKAVYSLRLEAPLDQSVTAVAKALGLVPLLDAASLAPRGIAPGEIVRVEVRDRPRDELLDALVAPLGLSWTITDDTLRVFAAPAEPAADALPTERPSVHGERHEIDEALVAAGLPRDTLDRLWRAVDAAVLPGMGSRIDGFLFLTRDPEWLAVRDRFAEFQTLRGIEQITPDVVARLRDYDGVASFPDVAALDAEAARCLDGFGADDWGTAVEFPAVRSLAADAAAALARCGGLVVLPNLESLAADAAAALAAHEGTGLVIGGFPRLSPQAAEALATCRSVQGILLPDLEALDSEPLARRLATQDSVFLPRVSRLTPEIAAALRGNDGGSLSLPGLVEVPPEVAGHMAGSGYFAITLGGVATLTPDAAAKLAAHPGPLVFTGETAPALETARRLDAHEGELVFQHLRGMSADLATALTASGHPLVLPGITHLDGPDAVAVASALAAGRGPLLLPALERITTRALAALAAKPDAVLPDAAALEVVTDPGGGTDDYAEPP